jgi:internalin A
MAFAAPSVKRNKDTFEISEGVNDEILTQIKAEMGEVDAAKLGFRLRKSKEEDLAALCKAYPNMVSINIGDKEITSIAPLAGLKGLQSITMSGTMVEDLTPLAGLTEMLEIDIAGDALTTPDLKWMSGMTKLTKITIKAPEKTRTLTSFEGIPSLPNLKKVEINGAAPADFTPLVTALPALEEAMFRNTIIKDLAPLAKLENLKDLRLSGSTVKDFSPLAGCPKLQKFYFGSTKESDYSTIGKLTQVREMSTEMNKLDNISWVESLPNLKILSVHAENVKDYSPIVKSNVEQLTIWNMSDVDLGTLSGAGSLKLLKLQNLRKPVGFEALASLVNLDELTIIEMKDCVIDLGFLSKLTELRKLWVSKSEVSNFDAVAVCEKLSRVQVTDNTGITSLAPLKKLPNLRDLMVTKGAFPDAEFSGFNEKIRISR